MKLPKLQQLKYLIALYDTGHFGQAAKKCFVSQSTLSSAIQALEEQLNSQLVERDHKTFVFTNLGKEVVNKARQILELSSDLVASASSDGDEFVGELHVGVIPTIAPFIFLELIRSCEQRFPHLKLFLREDTSENCLSLLREGQLDMLLLATPYEVSEFASQNMVRDPFFKVFQNPASDGPLYLLENEHCLTGHAISACKLTEDDNIHPFKASSLSTLLAIVEGHKGQTYLPQLAIKSGVLDNSSLQFSEIAEPTAERTLSLIWRKTTQRREFFTKVSNLFQEVLTAKLNK